MKSRTSKVILSMVYRMINLILGANINQLLDEAMTDIEIYLVELR